LGGFALPNPKARPPHVINLASLARVHTETCIKVLAGYARNPNPEEVPPAVRVQAVGMLLDRGWGKPSQALTVDGEGDIRLTIRHIIEDSRGRIIDAEPVGIEAACVSGRAADGG
jgi:hypothetical protein